MNDFLDNYENWVAIVIAIMCTIIFIESCIFSPDSDGIFTRIFSGAAVIFHIWVLYRKRRKK
jgi:hypothetical protein